MVGAILLVLVLVAGGAIAVLLGSDQGDPVSAPPITAPASTTPAVTPSESEYNGTLQALAIPMPVGAVREELAMGAADGGLDLDDVLQQYPDGGRAGVRSLLTSNEFRRGLFLAWTDDQGFLVYLQIYQFHYERQAAAWWAAEARGLTDVAESTAGIDEIEGGKLILTTTTPSGRSAAHARFCAGEFAVMLSIFRSGPTDVDYLKRIAVEQFGRLP
jgi:hypothetical protein